MDRQLAERMVGAACLLAVLVLVVPAILDGNPDPGATITHPAPEEALNLRTHTIRLDRAERDPPVPTAGQVALSTESSAVPAPLPGPETQPPSAPAPETLAATERSPAAPGREGPESPPPREPGRTPAVEAPIGGAGWFVQLGSFSRRDNADRLAAELQGKGFTASVLGGGGASGTLFRVRAGPEADRVAADALAGRLAAAGFPGGRIGR